MGEGRYVPPATSVKTSRGSVGTCPPLPLPSSGPAKGSCCERCGKAACSRLGRRPSSRTSPNDDAPAARRVRCGLPIGPDGRELRLPDRPWHLEVGQRGDQPILSFAWPDTPYSVLLWAAEDGRRVSYVNLQVPLTRTPLGFDTVDHALDVVVEIDRSSWRWKDEVELAEAVRDGLFTREEAADFRASGERAVERILGGSLPSTATGVTGAPTRAGLRRSCARVGRRDRGRRAIDRACRERPGAGACVDARPRRYPCPLPRPGSARR